MENMSIYEKVRSVPETAKRKITGGRLNGKTDINPMWRIKVLTETFGPCGTGWYVYVADKRIEDGVDGVKVAIVDLNLFYRLESGEWSAPVYGTGGNMLVDKERNGLYTSDEAFKMAYTDALSVCCKMLGVGADVYWEADRTKYSGRQEAPAEKPAEKPAAKQQKLVCECCGKEITGIMVNGKSYSPFSVARASQKTYGKLLCYYCAAEQKIRQEKAKEEPPAPDDRDVPPWEAEE